MGNRLYLCCEAEGKLTKYLIFFPTYTFKRSGFNGEKKIPISNVEKKITGIQRILSGSAPASPY